MDEKPIDIEKTTPSAHVSPAHAHAYGENIPEHALLKRTMKPRHIALISLGGVIGTGLFLGAGTALKNGGPLGLFLGYSIVGTICVAMMVGLGEMISFLPIDGHIALAARFVDPTFSFAMAINYAMTWLTILPAELSACAVLIAYWLPNVNPAAWISICLVVVTGINCFGARGYGEAEFIFASLKIILVVGVFFLSIAIDTGAGPTGSYIGAKYWHDPGPFVQYSNIPGSLGRFLGFWAVLTQAGFSYIGTEIVALTAGESENPRRSMKRSISRVYVRICLFYIVTVFMIGLIVPSNNAKLGVHSNAFSSPFVIATQTAGIKALPHIINAVLLTSAWSAGSADVYTSSRTLYSMALNRQLPAIFLKTTSNGLPWVSVAVSVLFGLLAFMSAGSTGAGQAFGYLTNLNSVAGLLSWMSISITYLRFRAGMDAQGYDRNSLPYKSRFAKVGAWYSAIFCFIICFFSGWSVFLDGNWNASTFFSNYVPMGVFVLSIIGGKLIYKTAPMRAIDMDFVTNIKEIEEAEFEPTPPTNFFAKIWDHII